MEQIRVVTIVFCLLLLLQIVRSVRREHIRVEYSMAWFGVAVLLLARIFNLMYELQTIQRPSASLLIGARAR